MTVEVYAGKRQAVDAKHSKAVMCAVRCSVCGVGRGRKCKTSTGKPLPLSSQHRPRILNAIKLVRDCE